MSAATGNRVGTKQIAHTFPKVPIEVEKIKHDYQGSAHQIFQ